MPSFFRAPPLTLLLVLPRRLVRADFAGQPPRLQRLWQSDAPMGETLAVLTDAAFALGPSRRTRVYLLAANFWMGVLNLSSAKAGTLSANELAQALGFEAESLSGINPFDSLLAAVPLAAAQGSQSFWVTQVSRAEVLAAEETLLRRGARLAGAAHPGGLPESLAQTPAPWQRAELWGDNVACLHQAGNELRLQIFPALTTGDLPAEAESWFGSQTENAPREILVPPGGAAKNAIATAQDLNHETALRRWLELWAGELDGKSPRVPALRPPPRPLSNEQRLLATAMWSAAAIALCAGHWFWAQHHERALQRELASVQAPAKKLDDLKSQAAAIEKKLAASREQIRVMAQLCHDWNAVLELERKRHAILLATIAQAAPDNFVLESLTEANGRLEISALADRPELPDFTVQLAAAVAPLDWRVQSPIRQALQLWNDGGPWSLDWILSANDTNAISTAVAAGQPSSPATRAATAPPVGVHRIKHP